MLFETYNEILNEKEDKILTPEQILNNKKNNEILELNEEILKNYKNIVENKTKATDDIDLVILSFNDLQENLESTINLINIQIETIYNASEIKKEELDKLNNFIKEAFDISKKIEKEEEKLENKTENHIQSINKIQAQLFELKETHKILIDEKKEKYANKKIEMLNNRKQEEEEFDYNFEKRNKIELDKIEDDSKEKIAKALEENLKDLKKINEKMSLIKDFKESTEKNAEDVKLKKEKLDNKNEILNGAFFASFNKAKKETINDEEILAKEQSLIKDYENLEQSCIKENLLLEKRVQNLKEETFQIEENLAKAYADLKQITELSLTK